MRPSEQADMMEAVFIRAGLHEIAADKPKPKPKRIQRKRTKGWKMPANTVYVGRPTQWGNPSQVDKNTTHEQAVKNYRIAITNTLPIIDVEVWLAPLKGKDLACWCKIGEPCHADVLLELLEKLP